MSFLGGLGKVAQGAVNFAPYAEQVLAKHDQRGLAEYAQQRQQKQDDQATAMNAAKIASMGGQKVTYKQDSDGNWVALPTTVDGAQPSMPSAPARPPMPSFSAPTSADWTASLHGGSPAPQQDAPPQQATQPTPPKSLGIPTGVKGLVKPPPQQKIDPLSDQGVDAAGKRAGAVAAAKAPYAQPKTPAVPKISPYSPEAITADSTKAANRAMLKPGGMTGGMGAGGIGGLARTSGAITELGQAHEMMLPYEEQIRHKAANYDGLDYFLGLRGKMYDAHGVTDQATHAAAFSHLNSVNPDLANYLRAAEMWALADGGVSGRTSDFRTKLDGFVSAIGPNAGPQQIDNTQRSRTTRLDELRQFQPAMRAAAQRFVQPTKGGTPSGATGNIDLGASSPLRQKYDAAVSHLKAQGKSDADILKAIGTPPGDE